MAPPISTADSLTLPAAVNVAAGDTLTIPNAQLHLNSLPLKADIEIAIDTTSSMGASLAQAKADATNLVNSVQASGTDAQFAVVQFRDAGDIPSYQVETALTSSASTVQSKINALGTGGGGDFPEKYNLVFHNSYADASLGWRAGSRKFVVVIGDAEPRGAGVRASPAVQTPRPTRMD